MRKLHALATVFALAFPLALVGCDNNDAKVKDEKTIQGPGGTSTITTEKKIENSGSNPPVKVEGDTGAPR